MCLQRHTDVCVTVSIKLNKVIYLCVHKPSPAMAKCLVYRHYYKIHLFFWCGLPTEQHSVPCVFKRMCRSLYLHSCKRTGASQVKALASCWPSGILCEQTLTIRAVIQRHCLNVKLSFVPLETVGESFLLFESVNKSLEMLLCTAYTVWVCRKLGQIYDWWIYPPLEKLYLQLQSSPPC